jgi:hypothetical protein
VDGFFCSDPVLRAASPASELRSGTIPANTADALA